LIRVNSSYNNIISIWINILRTYFNIYFIKTKIFFIFIYIYIYVFHLII